MLGKLRVLSCLGRGGSGIVYEVRHEVTTHRRALKVIHADLAQEPSIVKRFLGEATVAAKIDSPHVADTIDAGRLPNGQPYLLMEYLEGRPLDALLESRAALPVEICLDIARQACAGLAVAHEAGIVHRDLKPENLFLVGDDAPYHVKLLDFGIAKFTQQTVEHKATAQGALLGTPHYMSPEQFADGASVDQRTDIYSLGVVLYECLTGFHPYPSGTLAQLATRIMTETPALPSEHRPGISPGVDALVMRTLEKLPEDRFETARELGDAIEQLMEEVAAAPGAGDSVVASGASAAPRPDQDTRTLDPATRAAPSVEVAEPKPQLRTLLAAGAIVVVGLGWWLAMRAEPADGGSSASGAEVPATSVVASAEPPSSLATKPPVAPAGPKPAPPSPKGDIATVEESPE